MSREIMQQALPLLIAYQDYTNDSRIANECGEVIAAIETELANPEQEPVAWIGNADFVKGQFVEGRVRRVWWECNTGVGQPLYTEPPRKESENPDGAFIDEGSKPEQEPEICGWQFCLDGVWHDGSLFDNHREKAGDGEYLIRNVFTLPLKHKWVGITFKDLPDEKFGNLDFRRGALWAEDKLKEKNHAV